MEIEAVIVNGVVYKIDKIEYESVDDFMRKELDRKKEQLIEEFRKKETAIREKFELKEFELQREHNKRVNEIKKVVNRLKARENSIAIPSVSYENMLRVGMSVIYTKYRGYVWSCNILYSPKRIGGKYIKPSYINKMATIVKLVCEVDPESKHITTMVLYKVYGGNKFKHYHGYSMSSDCWGNFDYHDVKIENQDDFLAFSKKVESLLEDINDLSIATRAPKDLPRLTTLQKNLVDSVDEIKYNKYVVRHGHPQHNKLAAVNDDDNYWTV